MRTVQWLALLPLVAGLAACEDFGFINDAQTGQLRWVLDPGTLTKSSGELPDTNDFLLTILDAGGKTLYEGCYGDSPEYLQVEPGSYTVSVVSVSFTAPAFARPQYGDSQVVVVKAGQNVTARLCCSLLNAGIRLQADGSFLAAYPDGTLYLKQDQARLQYPYGENRIAFFPPGPVSVLLYNQGQDQTLFTRTLNVREILTVKLSVPVSADYGSPSVQVAVDTSKTWSQYAFVLGGDPGGGLSGEAPEDAFPVSGAAGHIGENQVWVYGYIVGGDLTSAGKTVKTADFTKSTHLALADRSSITAKASCLAVELPKGSLRDALNLVDHPDLVGKRVYLKGNLVESYFGTLGLKGTSEYAFP